jgi:hypothetical protein
MDPRLRGDDRVFIRALPRDSRQQPTRAPHFFDVVKRTDFGAEQMDNNVDGINHHPIAVALAFNPHVLDPRLVQAFDQFVGQGRHLARRSARCDHHIIGKGGLVLNIDDFDVFGLVIIKR